MIKVSELPEIQRKVMRTIIRKFCFANGKDMPNELGLEERIEATESLIDKGFAQVISDEKRENFSIVITEKGKEVNPDA